MAPNNVFRGRLLQTLFLIFFCALILFMSYTANPPYMALEEVASSEIPTQTFNVGRNSTKNSKTHSWTYEQACSCNRNRTVQRSHSRKLNPTSTCPTADNPSPHQSIASFSLYGPMQGMYFDGIQKNAKKLLRIYGGNWTMRVYHNVGPIHGPPRELCDLWCSHENLDFCDIRHLPHGHLLELRSGRVWRFLPMVDPFVDVFVSRDIDSLISKREAAAVHEWLKSNKTYHIMRDHKDHGAHIPAGMWGSKVAQHRDDNRRLGEAIIVNARSETTQVDQILLYLTLWPVAKFDCLIHDSFLCQNKLFNPSMVSVRPFPTRRETGIGNFVGSKLDLKIDVKNVKCPKECRPKTHQDWTAC